MLKRYVVVLPSLLIITAACTSSMDNQLDIKLNPHPSQRYELIVTADPPGPWDSVEGYVSYEVQNVGCTPYHSFVGVHDIPRTDRSFTLTRVGEKTWKGYFYRDQLQDADYFGLGLCHWEMQSAGVLLKIHGLTFNSGLPFLDDAIRKIVIPEKPSIELFNTAQYMDSSLNDSNVIGTPSMTLKGKNFPVTITVKKVRGEP